MTAREQEISIQSGSPFYLYEFNTDTESYRYIDFAGDYEWDSRLWLGSSIKHTEPKAGTGINDQSMTVTIPLNGDPFFQSFRDHSDARKISFNLYRGEFGQDDTSIEYKGRYMSKKHQPNSIVLTIESIATSARRSGCYLKYEKLCPFTVYDPHTCKLNPANWAVTATVQSVYDNGIALSGLSGYEPNYFYGGFITYANGRTKTIGSFGHINGSPNQFASVSTAYGSPNVGDQVLLNPGCNGTTGTCKKFGNFDRYLGLHFTPDANPFDSAATY
jgi:hypothetical protein